MTQTNFITEKHFILDGEAVVLRTKQSKQIWQFRMYINSENAYFRQSLRTAHLQTAIEKAKAKWAEITHLVNTNKKVFSPTIAEIIEIYLNERERHVKLGLITAGRLTTIKAYLKHLDTYLGSKTKISDIHRRSLQDYALLRRKQKNGIKNATINNEQATINACFRFCFDEGLIDIQKLKFEPLAVKDNIHTVQRATFTLAQFTQLQNILNTYTTQANIDPVEAFVRLLIQQFILISADTMMRFGELRQLKWGDVRDIYTQLDSNNNEVTLVKLAIRAETSKVRKSRQIVVRGGEHFKLLASKCKFKSNNDYVFCDIQNELLTVRKLYKHWGVLMQKMKLLDYKERNLTYYSLRHFGITNKVKAGVSYANIAKICGTSVAQIEHTYLHLDDSMFVTAAMQSYKTNKDNTISTTN